MDCFASLAMTMERVADRAQCAYFTAEKRVSNEFVCTTGAEPASWDDDVWAGAAAAVLVTGGFGAGLAACFGSAFGATRTTDCGLASATFGLAGAAATGAGTV